MLTAQKAIVLARKARTICDGDYSLYVRYSGRGMCGALSPLAFQTTVDPHAQDGAKLRALGFLVDSLGTGWIYYLPG